MPNWCYFEMKIKGKDKQNIEELIQILKSDYSNPHHFYRIFEAEVVQPVEKENDEYSAADVRCACAWSVAACMLKNGAYLSSDESKSGSCIEDETKRLKLVVEIFSEEPGACFMEHYIIDNGTVETDECFDYHEYWYDESEYHSIDEFNKAYNTNFTENDFDENGNASIGGIEWKFTI